MSLGVTAYTGGKTEARLQMMWLPAEGETPWQMCECAFLFWGGLFLTRYDSLPLFANQKELKD